MGTHPIFESDFDCLTEKGETGWRMPREGLTNILTRATFSKQNERVKYSRIDEQSRFLISDEETQSQQAIRAQLKNDGYRLDEISDDSDIDLILPSLRHEKTFIEEVKEKLCCCFLWPWPSNRKLISLFPFFLRSNFIVKILWAVFCAKIRFEISSLDV